MLDRVGIPQAKDRVRAYPHEFSGGMRQRAMIAMAIINNPDIIIADEPTTALDVTVQAQILETLIEVKDCRQRGGHLDHPRPRRRGRDGPPGAGDVRRAQASSGRRSKTSTGAADAVHRWAARLDPGAGQRWRSAAPDHRRAAVADQPAARLPVLAALPAGDRPVCQTDEPQLAADRPAAPRGGLPPLGGGGRGRRPDARSSVPRR